MARSISQGNSSRRRRWCGIGVALLIFGSMSEAVYADESGVSFWLPGQFSSQRGKPSLTATWPWAVAFSFGLLHGLGFANALIDIGLPQGDIPLALLAFNIGVEVGQLAFIAAVVGVIQLTKQFRIPDIVECRLRTFTAYGVGLVAAFWFVERLGGFWA
jgi:hypothetical protein